MVGRPTLADVGDFPLDQAGGPPALVSAAQHLFDIILVFLDVWAGR